MRLIMDSAGIRGDGIRTDPDVRDAGSVWHFGSADDVVEHVHRVVDFVDRVVEMRRHADARARAG